MIGATIRVTKDNCPRLAATLDPAIETALDRAVARCIAVADPKTRVDTGALRANKTIDRGNGSRRLTWNQGYAVYQNGGTRFMSGTHYADQGHAASIPPFLADLRRWGQG